MRLLAGDQSIRDAPSSQLCFARGCRRSLAGRTGKKLFAYSKPIQSDIAILDIEMPIKTGLEVLEWAKSQPQPAKLSSLPPCGPGYFEQPEGSESMPMF